jgi:hypothetical protein
MKLLDKHQKEIVEAIGRGAGYLELTALMAKQEGKKVMFDYLVIGKLAGIIKILTKESVEGK